MTLLLVNVLLALAWGGVTGSFTLLNLLFGFILGAAALYLIREQVGSLGYLSRMRRIVSLTILFLVELVISAWTVADDRAGADDGHQAWHLRLSAEGR